MSIWGNMLSFGGGGLKIKSIQKGITSVPRVSHSDPDTEVVSTISPVDLTKAIVLRAGQTGNLDAFGSYCRLTDATSVGCAVYVNGSTSANVLVHWTVIEFEDDVTIQRGIVSGSGYIPQSEISVSISSVNLNKSIVVNSGSSYRSYGSLLHGLELKSNNVLTVYLQTGRNESSSYACMPWQVVEFE